MVQALQPTYVCHAVELNIYRQQCGDGRWAAVVDFANQIYAAVKEELPAAVVFPSFQAGFLRGEEPDSAPCHGHDVDPAPCLDQSIAAISALRRDRFALSA